MTKITNNLLIVMLLINGTLNMLRKKEFDIGSVNSK
jgi:hypothetical protein